jgi:hypothetical protein
MLLIFSFLPFSIRCDGITYLVVKSEGCEAGAGIASTVRDSTLVIARK